MNDPLTPPPSPKPPPLPDYVPPPVIYPRPRHKPIFDAPIPRESYKRSVGSKIAITLSVIVAIPVILFTIAIVIGAVLPSGYGNASHIVDVQNRLEILVGAREHHVQLAYEGVTYESGMVCGFYTYPGDPKKLFGMSSTTGLVLSGLEPEAFLKEPLVRCVAAMPRRKH